MPTFDLLYLKDEAREALEEVIPGRVCVVDVVVDAVEDKAVDQPQEEEAEEVAEAQGVAQQVREGLFLGRPG